MVKFVTTIRLITQMRILLHAITDEMLGRLLAKESRKLLT